MSFLALNWKKIIITIIVIVLLYLLITGLLPYLFYRPKEITAEDPSWVESNERAVLVDDISDAWKIRLDLIENATETLDVAYYAFHGGETVPLFISYLYDAANRGVKVRLILDGVAHGMWQYDDYIQAFKAHPNIEFAYYQPISLIRPWTLQDRMHEKIIIADGKYSLTGGRNIGDKYFTTENIDNVSIDRDVMLMKTNEDVGLIEEIQKYYNQLWNKEDTDVVTDDKLKASQMEDAEIGNAELNDLFEQYAPTAPNKEEPVDWASQSYPIESGYLVANSLHSGAKEPRVWKNMLKLATNAEDNVFFQTPYAIPTRQMKDEFVEDGLMEKNVTMLTNSLNASNNVFAYSGYLNHRNSFIETPIQIYEYQPSDSQVHAKSLIVDDHISAIGSFNFDSRSAHLSTESMLVLNSPEFTEHFKNEINSLFISRSKEITETNKDKTKAHPVKKVVFNLIRPISKLIEPLL